MLIGTIFILFLLYETFAFGDSMPGKMCFDNSSCIWSDSDSFCNVLKRANVPLDEKWPVTILQLRAVDLDTSIIADQKADLQELLVKTLKERDFSEESFQHVRRSMSRIYLSPMEKRIKEITLEVNDITREVGNMLGVRTKDIISVASSMDKQLEEGKDASDVLTTLRHTLREVISKMERDSALFKYLATKDSLTGLANRRSFDSYLSGAVELYSTEKLPLALFIFDVDHFKQFNDKYGHLVGDQVLKHISGIAKKCVESLGGSSEDSMISRFGGDEFAIAIRGSITSKVELLADRLCKRVAQSALVIKDVQGNVVSRLNVTISIGVTQIYKAWHDNYVANLISYSDQALYEAKKQGRNRVALFDAKKNTAKIISEGGSIEEDDDEVSS